MAAVTLLCQRGEWAPLETLSAQGDQEAISELASISRQLEEARLAGDAETATQLAQSGEPALPRSLAERGDYQAAHTLATGLLPQSIPTGRRSLAAPCQRP